MVGADQRLSLNSERDTAANVRKGGFVAIRSRRDNRREQTLNLTSTDRPHQGLCQRNQSSRPSNSERYGLRSPANQAAIARSSSKPKARGVITDFPSKARVISIAIKLPPGKAGLKSSVR